MIKEYYYDCPHCGEEQRFTDPDILETKVPCSQCKGNAMLPDMLDFRVLTDPDVEIGELEVNEGARVEKHVQDVVDFAATFGAHEVMPEKNLKGLNPSVKKSSPADQQTPSKDTGLPETKVIRRGGKGRTVIKRRDHSS